MIRTTRTPIVLRGLAAALALVLAVPSPLRCQTAPATPEPPVFGVSAATVLLDIVIRDGRGRLVADLKAEDFEVYEDGVRQTVDSFRVVDRRPVAEPEVTAPPAEAALAPAAVRVGP